MENRSEGMLQLERDLAEHGGRTKRGEFASISAMTDEYSRILGEALPKMTPSERDSIQQLELRAHQTGAEILAAHGHPVPGSDPKKPN